MEKFKNSIVLVSCLSVFFLISCDVQAQVDNDIWRESPRIDEVFWNGQQQEFSNNTGLSEFNPLTVVTNVINIVMGFIGIMMVVLFMSAGFKIMLAGGNEDKMIEAQKMIWSTVVGTFLIMSSFVIVKFLIGSVANATGLY